MLLEARKLDKSFNGVYALKGLDLSLKEGASHGLVGENGAGKSTFIKILGGVYTKSSGELTWNGAPFPAEFGPVQSRELGINIIFQDHVLIPAFSALENIWLGRFPKKYGFVITNPPYGERIEEKANLPQLYREIGAAFQRLDCWSEYVITAYEDAEKYIGKKADKNRKIYNGMMKTYFYQFLGPKPPRKKEEK